MSSPVGPHRATAAELKQRLDAERAGHALLVYRDAASEQRICQLVDSPVTIGRDASADVRLEWDPEVSRIHAELQRLGSAWALCDDGLSRNGSFVNGQRVVGRRRLEHGDEIRLGATALAFRGPRPVRGATTRVGVVTLPPAPLSPMRRLVLLALCRPFRDGREFASPATNAEIAQELHLSLPAVKGHLRALFQHYGIQDLPQNEKRLRLVELGFESGAVSEHDYGLM